MLIGQEKYKEALVILNRLLAETPDNSNYRYNRAIALINTGDYRLAIRDLTLLTEDDPENDEYPYLLGDSYEHLDSLATAAKFYSKSISLNADYFLYFFKRGTVLLKLGEYADAIKDFDRALRINPEHHNSLHNRGLCYYKIGLKEKACDDWCRALLLGNTVSASHLEKNCKHYPEPCILKSGNK